MTQMLVCFLGTSGGMPTPKRALPAVAVRFAGELLLFDCGESTQRQLLASGLGFPSEFRVFLTHSHADHILGVPGVLYTLDMLGREAPVKIYAPRDSCDIVKQLLEVLNTRLGFTVELHEASPGPVYRGRSFGVEAAWAKHSVESLCYRLVENDRPGKMRVQYLEKVGLPRGPLWGRLQRGETVNFRGLVIRPEEAVDPPRPGRKIVYTGDTSPSDQLAKFAEGADLLIHDATFDQTLAKRSEQEGHSTAASAAEIALKARVKMLALFHISPRYHGREEILLNEARKIFPATILPNDLETLEIPYPERGLSV